MIENVINAMAAKDYAALAACFSEDCKFIDYCPPHDGGTDSYVYGRENVELFYRSRWVAGVPKIAEPVIENKDRATVFISYGGQYLYARISIEEYGGDGLIKKAIVHLA